ncbi:hypothetical protein AUJ46_00980 [Candidatus Peregrinibacteria bacterium CG1_02_54_53]|nr:MAG: hypothetical protein AUJ46_00980 [Candidatus Peregrinibacteria bacterium CG1_02_54_53]
MKRILIAGAAGPAGVNFIRSLRSAPEKYFLIGTDSNPYHLAWIRDDAHPENRVDSAYTVPRCNDPTYLQCLNDIVKREKIDLIYPQTDAEVCFHSEHRNELEAPVCLPAEKTIAICQDKHLSAEAWKAAGIPIQETLRISSDTQALLSAEEKFNYPYWVRASQGASGKGSCLVENRETAEFWLRYWEAKRVGWQFIAQQFLPGSIVAFQSVWKNGVIVCSQARERVEYIYPYLSPSGITGTPVIARTVHRDDVNEMATRAVRAIDPQATGVFCVDLRDNAQGTPIPTEINAGRFFTTSYFFTAAGINMPYAYIKVAFNEETPPYPQYNPIPPDWYWCRHIDCPGILVKEWQ